MHHSFEKKKSSRKLNLSMNELFAFVKLRPGMFEKELQAKRDAAAAKITESENTSTRGFSTREGLDETDSLRKNQNHWSILRQLGTGKDGVLHDASQMSNHIVILGCMDNIDTFADFSNSAVCAGVQHDVLFVGEGIPLKWKTTRAKHPNMFFLQGDIFTDIDASLKLNLKDAFSVVMLAHRREGLEFEENENLDFEMLFLYLKIASFIPPHIHFTVELTSGQNMSVLNSAAIRNSTKQGATVHHVVGPQVTLDFSPLTNGNGPDPLLAETNAQGEKKKTHVKQLSRQGVFATQFIENKASDSKYQTKLPAGRSRGSVEFKIDDIEMQRGSTATVKTWEGGDAHYNFAIYAAGRAYVPDIVDNLLCQSFFTSMTTNLCEALVCGRANEAMFLIECPMVFVSSYFSDIFRALIARNVFTMAIYKSPSRTENSVMPFVYTCPDPKTILNRLDKLFVYGNFEEIKLVEAQLSLPFISENRKQRLGEFNH